MKRLTNSEMKTFRRCRRKWWLSSVRGLQPLGHDFNRPTGIGNRVHSALAAWYDPVKPQDPVAFMKAGVARDLEVYPEASVEITKEAELAGIMLEGYMQWLEEEGIDRGFKVIAAEGAREAPLYEGVTLLAKLDARIIHEERQDIRLALEHKTVGDLSTPLPLLQLDTQLLTEHLVEFLALKEEGKEGEAAQGVLYNMLRKVKRTARAKPPFYGREEVRHNVSELRNHWYHVLALARELQDAERRLSAGESPHEVAYPNPTRDCRWDCPFFGVCTLFDDGSDPEAALAANFIVGDPLERYRLEETEE